MTKKSISQSRATVYNGIVKQLGDFFREEPQKLVNILHYEKGMSAEEIGRRLGVTGQSIRDKYLKKGGQHDK